MLIRFLEVLVPVVVVFIYLELSIQRHVRITVAKLTEAMNKMGTAPTPKAIADLREAGEFDAKWRTSLWAVLSLVVSGVIYWAIFVRV